MLRVIARGDQSEDHRNAWPPGTVNSRLERGQPCPRVSGVQTLPVRELRPLWQIDDAVLPIPIAALILPKGGQQSRLITIIRCADRPAKKNQLLRPTQFFHRGWAFTAISVSPRRVGAPPRSSPR